MNWPRLLLGGATVGLVVTCVCAALFSPRLAVQKVVVKGNKAIGTDKLLTRLKSVPGRNIVRLSSAEATRAVLAEPTIETAVLRRELPDTVVITVTERQPWASVSLPNGDCYTIDAKLVPFRKTEGGEKGLPRLLLSPGEKESVVTLGRPMTAKGLAEVSRCLTWARSRPDFVLESVAIDPTGKLCLNRQGGVQIRLGSAADLPKKLNALGLLLERRPDLKTGSEVAYVNLYAYDAPAVMPRTAALSPETSSALPEATGTPPSNSLPVIPRSAPANRGGSEPL